MIIDLGTYKTYKNINSTKDDDKHTLIIHAVNAFIEQYCGRVFTGYYDTDKVEYFSSEDTELFPVEIPIVSITSLETSTDNGSTYPTALVEYTDYIIDTNADSIIAINNTFVDATNPQNAIKLTYKGGYSKVPKDLEYAAVHLVDYYSDKEYTPRTSLAGNSIDNVIIPDNTARLPAHIRRVLENYRNAGW